MKRLGRDGMSSLMVAILLLLPIAWAKAQEAERNVNPDRFTQHKWAQIRPDFGYLNSCETGYRAFAFDRDGNFLFNNNVRGTWRVSPQGNLILRTRVGQRLTLFYGGGPTLTPSIVNPHAPPSPESAAPTAVNVPRAEQPPPPSRVIVVPPPSGRGAGTTVVVPGPPPPSAAAPTTNRRSTVTSSTTNPPLTTTPSSRVYFRHGDLFQECQ
jgi:hypothetical protein